MSKTKVVFCWSGGKDSAMCLYDLLSSREYEVSYLLTTVNQTFERISIHGVRESLLQLQADALAIPLVKVYVQEGTNEEYEQQMAKAFSKAKTEGITQVVYGDIFLEDLRKYREDQLSKLGMKAVFPLWQQKTDTLVKRFLALGFRSVVCCVSDSYLGETHVGAELDEHFFNALPAEVDPCGENGEYHSFCFAGPIFTKEIRFAKG
jgi:uncharacterized protein (TIGR00290 family)